MPWPRLTGQQHRKRADSNDKKPSVEGYTPRFASTCTISYKMEKDWSSGTGEFWFISVPACTSGRKLTVSEQKGADITASLHQDEIDLPATQMKQESENQNVSG